MADNLKIDLINGAYSQLRISGLTVMPSPEDIAVALRRLEGLAHELKAVNVDVGYNFENAPDSSSTSGIDAALWFAFEVILAVRLMPDFGKGLKPDPVLLSQAKGALSLLHGKTAKVPQQTYPARQPVGSGNAGATTSKYYPGVEKALENLNVTTLFIDDVTDFVEDFADYLIDAEVISAFTIAASEGLTLSATSFTDTTVLFRVTADGYPDGEAATNLKVKIVITTDNGRIHTRVLWFNLEEVSV